MAACSQCATRLPVGSLFCPRCGTPAPGADTDELMASSASDPTGLLDRLRAATEGEFRVIRELGRGGMGRVYLAHELALDRRVAMKVLPPNLAEHGEVASRFEREARTAGKLSHPHIVPVYQVSERGGLSFFTMPYVAGPSLRRVLRQTPQLSVSVADRYLRETAKALGYAHSQGVIHRDVKPENILLEGSRDGRLLVMDFGIAKALGASTTLTRPGDMIGTPYYMSPELCEERDDIDGRSDQYSLGLVAYEMLAGRFPLTADSMAGIVYKHLHEDPEPLEEIRSDVPAELLQVIRRATRKDPSQRFATMAELLDALGSRPRGAGVPAAPAATRSPEESAPSELRRRLGLVGLAASILVLGAVVWRSPLSLPGSDTTLPELAVHPSSVDAAGSPSAAADSLETLEPDDDAGQPSNGAPAEGSAASIRNAQTTSDEPPPSSQGGPDPTATEPDELPAAANGDRATIEQAHREAAAARSQAERARSRATNAGADSLFPAEFERAGELFQAAQDDLSSGSPMQGAIGFTAAGTRFEGLAARAETIADASQLAPPEDTSADSVTEPPTEDSVVTAAEEPEAAIQGLLETYVSALEANDLTRLESDLYRGAMPRADREMLDQILRKANDLRVELEDVAIDVRGARATVRAEQLMRFRLSATGEARRLTLSVRMELESGTDGWRLTRYELR